MSNLSQFLGGGTNKATAITASGSFAQPNNVQFVTAMLVGGGCGGMYSSTGPSGGGGGGGAIAFYDHVYLTGSLTVSIGIGGTGGTSLASAGAGGDTTITSNYPGSPTYTAQGNPATTRILTTDARYGYIGQHNLGIANSYNYQSSAGYTVYNWAPVLIARGTINLPATSTPYAYGGQSSHPFYGGGYGGTGSGTSGSGGTGQYSGLGVVGGAGGSSYGGGGGGAGIGPGGAGGSHGSGGYGANASANTGGGGGGGSVYPSPYPGGAGGSGYAMIFYVG
jgi:hypothetical protein